MTFAESAHQLAPRSLWFDRLKEWAAPRTVDEWLFEEANVRGYWGAFDGDVGRAPDSRLSDEDLIVGLLSPRATADGRVFKVVVRLLQVAKIDLESLSFRCRRERSDGPLHWLLSLLPENEVTPLIAALRVRVPRGYRPLDCLHDPFH